MYARCLFDWCRLIASSTFAAGVVSRQGLPPCRLDLSQRRQQVDVAMQAVNRNPAAPHRKAVAGGLPESELIGCQGMTSDSPSAAGVDRDTGIGGFGANSLP